MFVIYHKQLGKKINGPGVLCQSFYERLQEDDCPYCEFPSKVMRYEKE